ncbi:MAG: hypothetical protein ACLFWL_18215 [Candidatus Brocadiia bacterium]
MGIGKWWKLFSYKTIRGKLNILTDIIFHGSGRVAAIFDEIFHIIIDGGFSFTKFVKYGNIFRIFKGCGCLVLLLAAALGSAGTLLTCILGLQAT